MNQGNHSVTEKNSNFTCNASKNVSFSSRNIMSPSSAFSRLENSTIAYLFMKVVAFDHKNDTANARIKPWETNVSIWYSRTSNKTHIAVTPPSTPAETFLFLHKNTSAADNQKQSTHSLPKGAYATCMHIMSFYHFKTFGCKELLIILSWLKYKINWGT